MQPMVHSISFVSIWKFFTTMPKQVSGQANGTIELTSTHSSTVATSEQFPYPIGATGICVSGPLSWSTSYAVRASSGVVKHVSQVPLHAVANAGSTPVSQTSKPDRVSVFQDTRRTDARMSAQLSDVEPHMPHINGHRAAIPMQSDTWNAEQIGSTAAWQLTADKLCSA